MGEGGFRLRLHQAYCKEELAGALAKVNVLTEAITRDGARAVDMLSKCSVFSTFCFETESH